MDNPFTPVVVTSGPSKIRESLACGVFTQLSIRDEVRGCRW